ncbi:F-box/kelch-repeat protein At3g06240-like [Vicia villosa]|uniref:F-box/kelch-repeat protein At3g06240-like n=1 Tax=Vicia villosa TaxID=3911 RepID=UPI00273CA5C0|nr:F-box/kelch-repeat protein At3g06240-like [Vicia villosa]
MESTKTDLLHQASLPSVVLKKTTLFFIPTPTGEWMKVDINAIDSFKSTKCFCLKQSYNGSPVLWNPTTGESKVIPRSRLNSVPPYLSSRYVVLGFGYDSVTNNYKVVQLTDYRLLKRELKSTWELYSLRNNSWKELDTLRPNHRYYSLAQNVGMYVNGVSHWWARSESKYDMEECLISFDFSTEVLFTTPAPSYLDDTLSSENHLVLLNESIALISTYKETSTFHISILGELSVKESWTKLFVINHLPFIHYPIGVGIKNNLVFFKKTDGKLACIDLNTKMIEEDLGVNLWHYGSQIGKYKKSSLPIGGMHK